MMVVQAEASNGRGHWSASTIVKWRPWVAVSKSREAICKAETLERLAHGSNGTLCQALSSIPPASMQKIRRYLALAAMCW
jgi:hypothetical protein